MEFRNNWHSNLIIVQLKFDSWSSLIYFNKAGVAGGVSLRQNAIKSCVLQWFLALGAGN